jgi:hypothetical protein
MHKIKNFHEGHSTVGEWQSSGRGTAWYAIIGLRPAIQRIQEDLSPILHGLGQGSDRTPRSSVEFSYTSLFSWLAQTQPCFCIGSFHFRPHFPPPPPVRRPVS